MQLSPLQLLEYAFESFSVGLTPDYDNRTRDPSAVVPPSNMTIETESGIADIEDKEKYSDYALKLILKVAAVETGAPYSLGAVVRGTFRMHRKSESETLAERKQIALVNGISMLYGVAREMVSTVTSRSAHGQMLLPALNFSSLAKRLDEPAGLPATNEVPAKRASAKKVRQKKGG